jgi:hypothetical protein
MSIALAMYVYVRTNACACTFVLKNDNSVTLGNSVGKSQIRIIEGRLYYTTLRRSQEVVLRGEPLMPDQLMPD